MKWKIKHKNKRKELLLITVFSLITTQIFLGFGCTGPGNNIFGQSRAPDHVSGFNVIPSDKQVTIRWGSAERASEYKFFMDDDNGDAQFLAMYTESNGEAVFSKGIDGKRNMQNGVKYAFRVQARNSHGDGPLSDRLYAMPRPTTLGSINDFKIISGSNSFILQWRPVQFANKYRIFKHTARNRQGATEIKELGDSSALCPSSSLLCSYEDTQVKDGTKYFYWLEALMVIDDEQLQQTGTVNSDAATGENFSRFQSDSQVRIESVEDRNRAVAQGAEITLRINPPKVNPTQTTAYRIETLVPQGANDGEQVDGIDVVYIAKKMGSNPTEHKVFQPYGINRRYKITALSGNQSDISSRALVDDSAFVHDVNNITPNTPSFGDSSLEVVSIDHMKAKLSWPSATATASNAPATHYKLEIIQSGVATVVEEQIQDTGSETVSYVHNHNLGYDKTYSYKLTPLTIYSVGGVIRKVVGRSINLSVTIPTRDVATMINTLNHVDTFIGIGTVSGQHSRNLSTVSNVVPAASAPFGLVRVSPLNSYRNGYFWSTSWRLAPNWNDDGYFDHSPDQLNQRMLINGFSMNSLSGPGCPVKFDFPFMVYPGDNRTNRFRDRHTYSSGSFAWLSRQEST